MENLETGTVKELVRDPLLNGTVGQALFGCGHDVYYMLEQLDGYAGKLTDSTGDIYRFSIIRVDLDTFQETVVFERRQINTVLGININEGVPEESNYNGCPFFLDRSTLYVIYGGVRCIDLRTGETTVLDIPTGTNIAFDGNYIYYVDNIMIKTKMLRAREKTRQIERGDASGVCGFI